MKLNELQNAKKQKVFSKTYSLIGKVYCGFPGVGKSTLFNELKDSGQKVLDSDSSTFDKAEFPQNYIEHIKKSINHGFTVLGSSHDTVRDALIKEGINFTLVYPDISLKDEYLKRYKERGNPEGFIKLLDTNWDKWITQCDDLKNTLVKKIKLKKGEYISLDKTNA